MADTNLKPTNATSIADLRATIRDIDGLSQEGFSQIAAIASLALLAMKDPVLNAVDVEHALRVICGKAHDIENCINYEAEKVGCNHVDIERRQRSLAAIEANNRRNSQLNGADSPPHTRPRAGFFVPARRARTKTARRAPSVFLLCGLWLGLNPIAL